MVDRSFSVDALLARLGFAEPDRSAGLLRDPVLLRLFAPDTPDSTADHSATNPTGVQPETPEELDARHERLIVATRRMRTSLAEGLSATADPDLGALGLVRLAESVAARMPPNAPAGSGALAALLSFESARRHQLLVTLGGSRALVDHLVAHPEHWVVAADARLPTGPGLRAALTAAVRPEARGDRTAYDALRVAYRRELVAIAARDLASPDPVAHLPFAAENLAQLAEAALEAALAIAREEHGPGHEDCRLAIIGMGKTGGGELNYVSDVDVIFVAEPADGVEEERALKVGTALALATMKACSAATAEGTLWPVDPALRPEGKAGPLVRTIASHKAYYERWAKTWEFQALLKAWVSAGDQQLGLAYKSALHPLIWGAAGRDNFVEDVQAMRRRVEKHLPAAESARQLKLGPGGLRDVEFSVQLLQLVHGRQDENLRSATTLEALRALASGGYVGRDDAAVLDAAYRLLRTLEHRIQLYRLRRTHLMPTDASELRVLGRALGLSGDPATAVVAQWQARVREVRRIHERLFYRPLLSAAARLSGDDTSLSPAQARERLAALGFRDPAGAMRHLEALTTGVTRRAAIQRTLLPVMLGWFADEADPDAGLLAFRRVSDELGAIHWYLKMLRDEGSSAERLARVLGRSRYAADLLLRSPESVSMLGDPDGLSQRTQEGLSLTLRSAASRKDRPDQAMAAVGALRRHELLRIALADLTGKMSTRAVGEALSDLAAATIEAALEVALKVVGGACPDGLLVDVLVVGMGSLGGREMGYGSDVDVLVVHRAVDAVGTLGTEISDDVAQRQGVAVVQELVRLLAAAGPDALVLDPDLRPEGKNGPLSRSLPSYAAYYQRWAKTWEFQALLRARPVAGDPNLWQEFEALVDPLRYPASGLTPAQTREVRTMKARVESERLPRGADPRTHLKLGTGGLTDVEWTVQLIQLRHAHEFEALRTPGTLTGLQAAYEAGLVSADDAASLAAAYGMATRLRNANQLWRGRHADALPSDVRDADGIGRIVGREPGTGSALVEDYLRQARRARVVVESLFYESR
ncbi:MAG: bifunctional [glutamine synthetase] adenylyltransferase/[glutamine synthetase]-adenylyl-L-tyrosine phosphorylase [Candidatus Phosphoribacter sp.]